MTDVSIALIHYPVTNKQGDVITTSVTNFDIHDLARTARTYNVKHVFMVTPSEPQHKMVNVICGYWQEGFGAEYNPDRKEALTIVKPMKSFEECCLTIKGEGGIDPLRLATTAKRREDSLSFPTVREEWLKSSEKPVLIAFGTGHGLTEGFLESCDGVLAPIDGAGDYNHLPVRSAVAIILDRLLS